MNKLKIFLATPISWFQSEDQYILYRKSVLLLIASLSDNYDVYCELQKILDIESYDTPQDSIKKDFNAIDGSDIYIFYFIQCECNRVLWLNWDMLVH